MVGRILEYNKTVGIGYVLGFDDITYIFRRSSLEKDIELKKNDIIKFDCLLNEEMPEAVRVEKRKK